MEDKRIKILNLLRVGFKKTEVLEQLNVSRITVHQAEQN